MLKILLQVHNKIRILQAAFVESCC